MRSTATTLLVLLAPLAAAARLYEAPDEVTLWQEDFRDLELGAGGWRVEAGRLRHESTAAGLRLQAAPGAGGSGSLTRLVPVDLETDRTPTAYPYLILDLTQVEAGIFAGVGLADSDPRSQTVLIDRADRAGRFVFDLRRHLARRVGWAGALPLTITARGAGAQGPGPAVTLGGLRLASVAADRIELTTTALDGTLRQGDAVTLEVHLSAAAAGVTVTLAQGTPRRPITFDGRPAVELQAADATGQIWRAVVPVTGAATSLTRGGETVLVSADIDGGPLPRLLTSLPFDLDTSGAPPPPRSLAMPLVETAPIVDGRLDEEAWLASLPSRGFTAGGAAASPDTVVRLCRTIDTLYLAVTAEEPAIGGLRADSAERDEAVEADDSVIVDLAPQEGRHYQFAVNSVGTVADRRIVGDAVEVAWDADWAAVVERTGSAWTVEFAIPLAVLGLGEGSRETWGFNVERMRYAGGAPEHSAWAPPRGPVGRLDPAGFDPTPFRLQLSEPRLVLSAGPGVIRADLQLDVRNRTGAEVDLLGLGMVVIDGGPAPARHELSLRDGEQQTLLLPLAVPEEGRYEFVWRLFGPGKPRLLAAGRRWLEVVHRPLQAAWAEPVRDGAVAVGTGEVVAEVTVAGAAPGALLSGELSDGERVVARHSLLTEGDQARLSLGIADLPAGDYTLAVRLSEGDRELAAVTLPLNLRAAAPVAAVSADPSGLMRVRGELFLPVGWVGEPPGGVGANLVVGSTADPERLLIADLSPLVTGAPEAATGPLSEATRAALAAAVEPLRRSEQLFGYLLADTPEALPVAPDYLRACRELLAELDPEHPCLIQCRGRNGIERYAAAADLVVAALDAGRLPAVLELEALGRRPVWLGLTIGAGTPSAALRSQLLLGLAAGARGFVISAPGEAATQHAAAIEAVRLELVGLTPALLGAPAPEVTATAPAVVWARRLTTGLTVLVANPGAEAVEVTVSGLPDGNLERGSELLPATGGRLPLRLGPFEVQLLRSAP